MQHQVQYTEEKEERTEGNMFETEKKLEDFMRNNVMVTEADFDKMSYQERCQLYNDHPEEYRRVTHKGTTPPKKVSGHKYSSQIRR